MKELYNVSGEPREYEEKGVIYEFPFPAKEPTQVDDDVAKKLLETGQFKEGKPQLVKVPLKEETKKEIKEVEEDAI